MWLNVLKAAMIMNLTNSFYFSSVSVFDIIESSVIISITTYSGVLYKQYSTNLWNVSQGSEQQILLDFV